MTPSETTDLLEKLLSQTRITREKQRAFFKHRKEPRNGRILLEQSKTEEANLDRLVKEIDRKINMTQTKMFL